MYTIALTEIGRAVYAQRDVNVERAVVFLIERIGPDEWRKRKAAIVERMKLKLVPTAATDPVGVSIRERDDEIGWYIYQGEQVIGDPTSTVADQAARVMPYLSTLGRKLDAILRIQNIDARIDALVKQEKNRDPDQGLFELIVGGSYAQEGWQVTALAESGAGKTPDFEVRRAGQLYVVECKRMTRRSDYTERERNAWMRLWQPVREWLIARRVSLVWTIVLHREITSYPSEFLLDIVRGSAAILESGGSACDDERCTITAKSVDYAEIQRILADNYVKRNSSRERQLITGEHRPQWGLSLFVHGHRATMGEPGAGSNEYWESIDFVSAAYWRCDAPEALSAKARNIRTRLSEATAQLSDTVPGIVHIGIETADGDDVEWVRSPRVMATLREFDPRGKRLSWVYLHSFRGESPPDELWAIDETCQWFGGPAFLKPLKTELLLGDDSVPKFERAHWEQPRA